MRDVRADDRITELDTPSGPFYKVTEVDHRRGVVVLRGGDGVERPVPYGDGYVLRLP